MFYNGFLQHMTVCSNEYH